jgi:hypothetical protein
MVRYLSMDRRSILKAAAGLPLPLHRLAAAHQGKAKITDVKVMIVRGAWDWNRIRIETGAGIHGIGEADWGYGVERKPDAARAHLAPGGKWRG